MWNAGHWTPSLHHCSTFFFALSLIFFFSCCSWTTLFSMCIGGCVRTEMPGNSSRNHTHIRKKAINNNNFFFFLHDVKWEEEANISLRKQEEADWGNEKTHYERRVQRKWSLCSPTWRSTLWCLNCIKTLLLVTIDIFFPLPFVHRSVHWKLISASEERREAYLKHKICNRPMASRPHITRFSIAIALEQ